MNIAYLISAHTDAPQLKRLIEALHPDAHYFIHIDQKSNMDEFFPFISGDNIHFIPARIDVRWGTMLEVHYQMALLRAAVLYPIHFDRIFFLSGMDYPLWSTSQITKYLESQKGKELLQGYCMDTNLLNDQQRELYSTERPLKQNERWGILLRKAKHFFGIRKPLHFRVKGRRWKLYKGSAWWCVSQELASHLLDYFDHYPAVQKYFVNSFCPAETLIQTIAFNCPQWANRCILTKGPYPGLDALTPLHFIDYNPVIKILDESDYTRLIESGKMFCRKVVSGKSDELVALIEAHKKQNL